ncbi:MAG: thioredoxin family protein [Planctomycetes bacterium]|nr:thioredoxin family protein [Planctomycetota bacterium]
MRNRGSGRLLVAGLVLIVVCRTSAAAAGDEVEKHYAAAVQAEAGRDFKTASSAWEKVLDIDPEYKDALSRWEACQALAEWQAALGGPVRAEDLVRLGEIYCRQERIDEERRAYEDAIQLDAGCADAHGHLAMSHYTGRGGSMVVVVHGIRRLLETSPHRGALARALADWDVYGQLRIMGHVLKAELGAAEEARKAGDSARAAGRLQAAAARELPDVFRTVLHAQAGKLRERAGDAAAARAAYLEALKHVAAGQYTIEARLGLARLDTAAGDLAGALAHLGAAVAEGSLACRGIAAERDGALKPLFAAAAPEIRAAVDKLVDPAEGDAPIRAEIEQAVARAAREGKRALIEWYGPYCPYVMSLEERLAHPRVAKILEERFVLVRMSQGSMHRGLALDEEYGGVMHKYGVPCFFVLNADGSVHTVQPDAELMSLRDRAFDVEKIAAWLLEAAR